MTCFRRQFLRRMWPILLQLLLFTVCRIFLSALTLVNASSSLTRSVKTIFSILLQHHISKLPKYFSSTFHSVKSRRRAKLCSKCSIWLVSLLNCVCFADDWSCLVEQCFWHGSPGFNFTVHLASLRYRTWWLCYICRNAGSFPVRKLPVTERLRFGQLTHYDCVGGTCCVLQATGGRKVKQSRYRPGGA
jgi:hypothetical protein